MPKSKRKAGRHNRKMAKACPGPKPDTLKIKGTWERAVKKSLKKKKPPKGWPK